MNAKAFEYVNALKRDVHRDAQLLCKLDGFTVMLPCTGCGIIEAFRMNKRIPPDQIKKKLQDQGWTFESNRRATCPAHKPARKEKSMDTTVNKPSGEEQEQASERARAAKRETVLLLEDVFDVERGCYKGGESDESVGKTVGLSPQAVQFIRESFFGPIKRPPELASVDGALRALEQRHEAMVRESNEAIKAAAEELRNMRQRVDALMRKYQ